MSNSQFTELALLHAKLREDNPYCYFELAYTRYTGWMAWLCTNSRDYDQGRKVITSGQGDSPELACTDAMKNYQDGKVTAYEPKQVTMADCELYKMACELNYAIEALGASPELTAVVTKCSTLISAISEREKQIRTMGANERLRDPKSGDITVSIHAQDGEGQSLGLYHINQNQFNDIHKVLHGQLFSFPPKEVENVKS